MKKQAVKSTASFAVVLMVLSIIPSGAFALENGTTTQLNSTIENEFGKMMPGGIRHGGAGLDGMLGMGVGSASNITEENFAEIQAEILNSITEKIAELQSKYENVSEASSAEELQEVLLADRPANAESAGFGEKNGLPCEMYGSCLFEVANLTDENFTEVQTNMLDSLQDMTEQLEEMQTKLEEAGEDDRAEELNEKIAELQNLYADVSEASAAAELEDILFDYLQTRTVDSLETEIEMLNARLTGDENATDEKLESRIEELTALIADVEGAESLDELREIMSSEMKDGKGPMQQGGPMQREGKMQGGRGNMPMRPENLPENGKDDSTED
ncbi:hypothetical protein MSSIT_1300 [Methanosarcina siciliae T4/M]|uniref:Uncharacterized protein n=2 Tax=Methanosarcina siciliae TaxID=38027 RepID=A0A0E3PC89_9EURY|nr:hypothetical protein [Methanosarcina siciliae]AKB28019.1 hypothetical protein MSSIT_1300 [Methanosarcina siciliae T4/M]AKB31930.1 hypothetical protein MSSIH_1240 [Methanosarcina siciliae HI350]